MRFFIALISVMALIATYSLILATAGSADDKTQNDYYRDSKRGYWWYEKEPEKPKEERDDKKASADQKKVPSLKDYSKGQLWNMHPDDFKALRDEFLKKAVQVPSEENVREFYIVNDIARRKALAFTNVTGYVMQKYPDLSVNKDYPVAAPGMNALTKQKVEEIEKVIRNSQDDFGLIYFYSPTCQYCIEQDGILYFFLKKYGWDIKRVDINIDSRLASRFGVTTTPYIVLVYRNNPNSIPVSAGVISMSEMEDKLYRGIRLLKGEITPEEYSLYEFQKGGSFDVNAPLKDGIEDIK
ncbi:MAG: conjugal transfer protein TraF [Nitrospirae bacterium]|nr:conjugal transfer protein TraF [Nitrospirota bacterium]MCL5237061.1 conjugal transfer protein TraF [Nitrospirota bacterium]